MRFQIMFLCSVIFLSLRSSYVISFNGNFRQTIPTRGQCFRFHDGINDFRRCTFLQSTISNDPAAKEAKPITGNDSKRSTTHIVFPGGGIFFYYQAGLVNFLRERYDLSSCTFAGASAGALTATLTAANVDFFEATDLALNMAADAGVWDRSGGLQGIWGPMIEDWLDELLPESIDNLQGRISLLVTPLPSFGKSKISRFEDRQDLIKCNMASVHLPWFLDGKLTSDFRGKPHIDGSFLSKEDDYRPEDDSIVDVIVLNWGDDPEMSSKGGFDIVEALSPEGIYGLLEQGKQYGKVLEDRGVFDSLEKLK